jgi:uncharacterized protein YukJ
MPLKEYGVLVGRPIDSKPGAGQSPHYQIRVVDETTHWRIAINVKSKLFPSELLYQVIEDFRHPVTDSVSGLAAGFHELASTPDAGALDFIRGNLFDPKEMRPLPHSVPGPDNDLNEKIAAFVSRAIQDEHATIYVFGERWGPEPGQADKHFGFLPGNGIHDVHMNQGNSARFKRDDGVWQDGAVLLHFPAIVDASDSVVFPEQWVGVFLAFQSQCWHTDDTTGHCLGEGPGVGGGGEGGGGAGGGDGEGGGAGGGEQETDRDGQVRIVAALVNPAGHDPGRETVTLVNITPEPIDLGGWAIADKNKKRSELAGAVVGAGEALVVTLDGQGAQLSNKGGIITLLDDNALKVDGVAYTRDQVRRQGWSLVF